MNYLEAEPAEVKKDFGLAFYWTCKFLNKDAIHNVNLIYAFYRYTKTVADVDNKDAAIKMLSLFENELDKPSHTFMVRLVETLRTLKIDPMYAREVISAARFDASNTPIENHNQLIVYCYKNMGALGQMLAPALGAKQTKCIPFAVDLGMGANIMRNCAKILEDAKAGKVFFPKTDLDHLRLSIKDLSKEGDTPYELKKLVERYVAIADNYLASSLNGLVYLPLKVRIGTLIAVRASQQLGQKLKRHDFEVLEGKYRLSKFNKFLVFATAFTDMFRPRFWIPTKREAFLHQAIAGLPTLNTQRGERK